MQGNKEKNNIWWRPAMLVFSEITTWIAFPMILALFVGKALDKHYNTYPIIFLSFAFLGFLVSSLGIVRTVKRFVVRVKKEESKKI